MTYNEIETLEHFLIRTSMWIHPINRTSIVSFIHGFEAGIRNKTFTTKIKEFLALGHGIDTSSQGWPHQIFLYSEKEQLTWNEAFLAIGYLVLKEIKND